MPGLMRVDQWLKLTDAGLLAIRSATLERVDAALRQYNRTNSPADKQTLQTALDAFIRELGPNWKTNVRNNRGAIADLQRQLQGHLYIPDASERAALRALKDESRRLVEVLFRDKQVTWRQDSFGWLGSRKLEAGKDLLPGAVSVGWESEKLSRGSESDALKAEKWAQEIFDQVVPPDARWFVLAILASSFPEFMRKFAASVLPFVGIVTAGGTTAYNLGRWALASYRVNEATRHAQQRLNYGEPALAIRAIIVILDREKRFDRAEAVVSSVEFCSKAAGMFLDAGTASNAAIGAAANAARFVNLLRVLVRDYREMCQANEVMKRGANLQSLFQVCPLAGCYYICCVPTSVLVNEILERFWLGSWQGEVEYNVANHIEPLREQARRVIGDHRFTIKGLERFPGVMAQNEKALEKMYERFLKDPKPGYGPAI